MKRLRNLRRLALCLLVVLSPFAAVAQNENTSTVMAFQEFQPAQVKLVDGRTIKVPKANVFLKHSTLVYKSGTSVKEANMKTIQTVDFDNRHYVRIDTVLAFLVDTVEANAVYQQQVIDRDAYEAQFRNDRLITGIQFGEQINLITLDPQRDSTAVYPVVNTFYYRYNGKIMKVHDRELWRQLPKEKRRIMQSMMAEPGFSWTRRESVVRMLQALTGTLFK
ncbi:MAG: hypothetical protein IJV36_01965 [Prevotella sp.]|nr:hypothetical protein [Prevotella sp.]